MSDIGIARCEARVGAAASSDMADVQGGEFLMGSDLHYPEERPARGVKVDGFRIDPTPVTNRNFRKFVEATGYVTFAGVPPEPKDYPGILPHILQAGSLLFTPPDRPVDLQNAANWWAFVFGADWRRPCGEGRSLDGLDDHPVVHVSYRDAEAYAAWAGKALPTGPSGSSPRAAGWTARSTPGGVNSFRTGATWPTPGRVRFRSGTWRRTASSEPPRLAASRRTLTASST